VSVLLALAAAAAWGTTDFLGGVAARHATARAVATVSQMSGLVTAILVLPWLWGDTSSGDVLWGLIGGAGGGLAVMVLYRGFQRGRISLTSPIAAVGTALFPTAVSILSGDPVTGIQAAGGALGIVAIWVLAGGGRDDRGPVRASVLYGVLAGLGFALLLIGLGQVQGSFGAPLVASKIGGAVALLIPGVIQRLDLTMPAPAAIPAVIGGVTAVVGNVTFLAASSDEGLAVVPVLAAMFPAFTVGLAVLFLGEALTRRRLAGLALALVAIGIIVG
jgi:drug/metabolite transporter (DMT)-like permease